MKTLTKTLLNTFIIVGLIGLSIVAYSQSDYFDAEIGALTEEDGADADYYDSDFFEDDDTVYDNVIIQYADGTEYRSSRNNINNQSNPSISQPNGKNYPQKSTQNRRAINNQPNTGYGENLYNGGSTSNNDRGNSRNNDYTRDKHNSNNGSSGNYNQGSGIYYSNSNPDVNNRNPRVRSNNAYNNPQNNELQDLGIEATRQLHSGNFHGPTPNSIPGGQVITTQQLQSMVMGWHDDYRQNNSPLIFDVLDGQQHLPGAIPASQGAAAGNFNDQTQQRMGQFLSQVTRGNKQVTMVYYCQNIYCWMSYNAALRAINLGYQNVYWYRGGIDAWQQQGLSVQYAQVNNYGSY